MTDIIQTPCLGRIDAACFRHNPAWARRAFAYRLLHTLFPGYITRRLPRGLRLALIGPLVDVPPGLIIPDGTVVAPGAIIPAGWQPGDPYPDGWIPPPALDPTQQDTGATPPTYVAPWEPGPPSPPGGRIPAKGETLETLYSVASGDDGTWKPGQFFYPDAFFLYFGFTPDYKSNIFMTFHGLLAPQGSNIISASVTFHSGQTAGDDIVDVIIFANKVDNPTNPTDIAEAEALVLTNLSVAWDPGDWVLDEYYDTPDLHTIIQEIVDRPGWVSGNNIMIIIKATDTSEWYRAPGSWDGTEYHDMPALHVSWLA